MIEVANDMLIQCFELVIPITLIILVFEFLGSFVFGKK